MSTVELNEVEKRILPTATVIFSQRVANHAKNVIELCKNEANIEALYNECERMVRSVDGCKILWNMETQKFGGDQYPYVWMFFSEVLSAPIKISVNIDAINTTLIIGNMELPNKREEKSLVKEVGSNGTVPATTLTGT